MCGFSLKHGVLIGADAVRVNEKSLVRGKILCGGWMLYSLDYIILVGLCRVGHVCQMGFNCE